MNISRTCCSVNKLNALTWSNVGKRRFLYKWFSWGLLPAFTMTTLMSANVHVSDSQWGHFHLRLYGKVLLNFFFGSEMKSERKISYSLWTLLCCYAHTHNNFGRYCIWALVVVSVLMLVKCGVYCNPSTSNNNKTHNQIVL